VAKIKYNKDIMGYISIFESLTGAKLKDCILNEHIMFIVHENEMGKAIGKKGSNIRRVEGMLKKKIRLVEFSSNSLKFVENLIHPLRANEIKDEENTITIYSNDTKTKGMLIGRDRHNIKSVNSIVKRYFDIKEVRVGP
jgi:transcription termination/antitermination protein NusA